MIELAATHFLARKPKSVTVANRTLERGSKLADRLGADAITLNELPERLREFDIVVTCTASTLPIIGKGLLERVVKQRRHAPVFIVDLGVPRDVEARGRGPRRRVPVLDRRPRRRSCKENLSIRREAVVQAEQMIADQTEHFLRWLEGRSVVPTIDALSGHHDDAARRGARARAQDARRGGASPEQVLDALARGLTSKLLHAPLSALNAAGDAERAELIAALTARLSPRRH